MYKKKEISTFLKDFEEAYNSLYIDIVEQGKYKDRSIIRVCLMILKK